MGISDYADTGTRSRTSRCAHVIERTGLAMAGASCGLFVAAHVANSRIEALSSIALVLVMMVLGAFGFYLGIDLPPRFRSPARPAQPDAAPAIDPIELLSAAGIFLTAGAALVSVYLIIFDATPAVVWTVVIGIGWLIGACAQILAGASARLRRPESAVG